MTKLGGAKALLDFVKRADLNFAEGAATVRQLPAARDSQRSCPAALTSQLSPLVFPNPSVVLRPAPRSGGRAWAASDPPAAPQ